MDEETVSLTNNSFSKRKSTSLYAWWALNIGIVIFVFLAFLFSALTYSHSKHLAKEVNNSFVIQQGGLISVNYKVSEDSTVSAGQVVSFCGTNQVCAGLGPKWGRPFHPSVTSTPAVMGALGWVSQSLSVYAYVVDSDHTTFYVSVIDTSDTPSIKSTIPNKLDNTVTDLKVVATDNSQIVAIYYVSHNASFLVAGAISSDNTSITLQQPVQLFTIDVTKSSLRTDVISAGAWIFITYGYEGEGCTNLAYTVAPSTPTKLASVVLTPGSFNTIATRTIATAYLGGTNGGWIIQANAQEILLGWIHYDSGRIDVLAKSDFGGHFFDFLTITPAYDNYIIFTGVQTEYVDQPLTLAYVGEWYQKQPYLMMHTPVNLFSTQNHQISRDQISVSFSPAHDQESVLGGLFFTYVDAQSGRAKLMRARTTIYENAIQILPSPGVDISVVKYDKPTTTISPILSGPTTKNHVMIVVQDWNAVFNTFTWQGGYRYAGIAQAGAVAGLGVHVVRQGISAGHSGLITGFRYYANNSGVLAPYTSFAELFTPNGLPFHVGTAISDTQLYIENDIFDRTY